MTQPIAASTFPRMGHGLCWSELVQEMADEAAASEVAKAAAEAALKGGPKWLQRALHRIVEDGAV